MNDSLQRMAIAITLGLALVAMGHYIDSWEFWCIFAMMMCSNFIHYKDGVETGVSQAVEMWVDMTEQQRQEMIDLVIKVRAEDQ